MKILRSVSQRGFSVGTAGWFTILRPNTWFPATRLQGVYKAHTDGIAESAPAVPAARRGEVRPVRWLASEWNAEERNRVRAASAMVGALVITSVMLWWIMHP